jgi:hypothetical protein
MYRCTHRTYLTNIILVMISCFLRWNILNILNTKHLLNLVTKHGLFGYAKCPSYSAYFLADKQLKMDTNNSLKKKLSLFGEIHNLCTNTGLNP